MKARYCASLTLNRTQIGSSGTIVVSGCAAFGFTRPPTGTSVSPIRPLMGARMVPYCRLSVAVSQRAALRLHFALRGLHLGFGGEPRLLHVRLVGAHAGLGGAQRGHRGVQILLGGGVLLHQRLQAFVILLRLDQVGLRGGQVGLRLPQRNLALREIEVGFGLLQGALRLLHLCLERPQIQDVQRLAGLHFLTRPEQPFLDVAFHPAAHIHHVAGVGLAGIFDVDIGIPGVAGAISTVGGGACAATFCGPLDPQPAKLTSSAIGKTPDHFTNFMHHPECVYDQTVSLIAG